MEFEWDAGNQNKNWLNHGVTKEEAEECFFNLSVQFDDVKHSQKEPRYILLGITHAGRTVTIVYTRRNERVRVISARPMSRKERELYEKYRKKENAPL